MADANPPIPCPTCGYQIDRVERINAENARQREMLRVARAFIEDKQAKIMTKDQVLREIDRALKAGEGGGG